MQHICWDGCMFPNAMPETQNTWRSGWDPKRDTSRLGGRASAQEWNITGKA